MLELQNNEHVIMYIRKHWIFILLESISVFALFAAPVVLVLFFQFSSYFEDVFIFGVSLFKMFNVLIYVWAILCWLLLTDRFVKYSLNFWVLTNRRIIETELKTLFDRKLSTLELQDVEDITVSVSGFIRTIIGYGSLEVQTAGTMREFIASDIYMPVKVQEAIFEAKLQLKEEEKDLDRSEFEQISERVMKKNAFTIPSDQTKVVKEVSTENLSGGSFDWAHNMDPKQGEIDPRVALIEDKYKTNTSKALRVE